MTEKNDIVRRALVVGWCKWEEGRRPSQCLYRTHTGKVAFVEGGLRQVVCGLVDKQTGRVDRPISGGIIIKKRLAARLADWAGWGQGSVAREELVGHIESGGEAEDIPKHEVWSARRAYSYYINDGSCECNVIDSFRFSPTSCMADNSEHGRALDEMCGDSLQIWVWDDLEGEDGITRVEVWVASNGDMWAGAVYGCPVVLAHKLTEYLRGQGVRPLSEMEQGLALYVSGESLPYSIGYCDYLHYNRRKGGWYVTAEWRPKGHPSYTDVIEGTVCEECGEWMDVDCGYGPEGRYCDNECVYEAGYQECRCCGEWFSDNDGCGPDSQFCSDYCAGQAGYRQCSECGDWFSDDDGCGPDGTYCCEACAGQAGHMCCDVCGEWFSEGEGYGPDDKFCSLVCSIMGRETKCRQCGTVYKVSKGPHEELPYCSRECALKADAPTCLWCNSLIAPGEGIDNDKFCSGRCYEQHRLEFDVRQGQMFLNNKWVIEREEVSV